MTTYTKKALPLFLILFIVLLAACSPAAAVEESINPAEIIAVSGSEFNQVILTERAAQRLGIETDTVREVEMDGKMEITIPYAAILYGLNGETWAYVQVKELTYSREIIEVKYIEGDLVAVSAGPSLGTEIVTVGVAQLYGADTGVGK